MKFRQTMGMIAIVLVSPALHAQASDAASIVQSGPAANAAIIEQRNNSRAVASLVQSGGARAGVAAAGQPGILQVDGGRLSAVVTQQGDASASVTQQRTDLGWATVTQQGYAQSALVVEQASIDVTADIRQWNAGNRSTQLQTGLANGTADSWQSGDGNASRMEQVSSRVVIGVVLQEGSMGDAAIVQDNVQGSAVHIRQAGTFARASVTQHDGVNLNAFVRQSGGSNQYAVLEQSGMNKNAELTQRGSSQLAGVRQR